MSDSDDSYTPEVSIATTAPEPKKVTIQSPGSDSSKTPELEIVNDNDNGYDPGSAQGELSINEINKQIDVPLFTNVVTYFLSSPLQQDPTFEALTPSDKSTVLLQAYNNAHSTSITGSQVNLNFAATTSYNKNKLRPRDEPQPTVPINPYCHRTDITKPMSPSEYSQWKNFLDTEDKYSKEFNCMVFPSGSRLFVGNLAVNTLKQQDVWRIFRPYGKIAAVNMKQGFGFVQFTDGSDCTEAIKGEIHVPLHNRLMELQVSKTHERHKEMKAEGLDPTKSDTPARSQQQQQQQQHTIELVKPEILILLTTSPSPTFNSLLVNTFQESDIECQIKHVETDADDIDQDIISQAAYGGKTGIVITRPEEVVDLMLFSKEESKEDESDDVSGKNGAIRFDNYESISMESAIGWINEHVKKINDKIKASQPRQRDTRSNKSGRGEASNTNNNNNNNNNNRSRNYRDRDDNRRSNYDDRERPYREGNNNNHNRNNNRNDRHGGNRQHDGQRYSEREQYNQKHKPVTTTGFQNHHNQQPLPPQMQQGYYPPQQGYGGYQPPPPQNGYYPPQQPYYNGQQQQQYYPPPQGTNYNGNIYSQPPYGVQYPNQPGALPGMTTNSNPMIPPTNGNNVMGGLLSQLQSGSPVPGQPAAPVQPKPQDDSTAALFETLARLKNNM